MKHVIRPADGPPSLTFVSPAVRVGGFVFVSGHVAFVAGRESPTGSPLAGALIEGGVAEQTRQCLENVRTVLAEVGAELHDVVKVNAFLRDVDRDFEAFNSVYRTYFDENPPARTTVGARLIDGILVEIECVAFVGDSDGQSP